MLLNPLVTSWKALRSASVSMAAEARASLLRVALLKRETQTSSTGLLVWTALTMATRHSRISVMTSMAALRKPVEKPVGAVFAAGEFVGDPGSARVIWFD